MTAPITDRPRRKPGPKGPRAAAALVPVSARVTPALADWLDAEATRRGCSKGTVVRTILTAWQRRSEAED
jgi:hypothetical protein